jgi:hypothetical protein
MRGPTLVHVTRSTKLVLRWAGVAATLLLALMAALLADGAPNLVDTRMADQGAILVLVGLFAAYVGTSLALGGRR